MRGAWSGGATGNAQCVTGANGTCTLTKSNLARTVASVTFTVSNLTQSGYTYTPSANHDPDGDSNGTSILVPRPYGSRRLLANIVLRSTVWAQYVNFNRTSNAAEPAGAWPAAPPSILRRLALQPSQEVHMLLHAIARLRPVLAGAALLSLLGFAPAVAQASDNSWGKPYNQMPPQGQVSAPSNYDHSGYGHSGYGHGNYDSYGYQDYGQSGYDNSYYGNDGYGYNSYSNYDNNGYGYNNYNNYDQNGYNYDNYGYQNYGQNGYGNDGYNYGYDYTNRGNATFYRVVPGDTLAKIAARFGTTIGALLQANPSIGNPNVIYSGQTLAVPAGYAGWYQAPAPHNPPVYYNAPQPTYRPPARRGH